MLELLLLTGGADEHSHVLPALGLLPYRVTASKVDASSVISAPPSDAILINAREDLASARTTCRLLRSAGIDTPLVLILTEGGLTVVSTDWGADEILLDTAGPAEVSTRLRLLTERAGAADEGGPSEHYAVGELSIDPSGYIARLRGVPLDLTYKEFELIKHLIAHPGRGFTRSQLLQEVWGYDYYGGTRTVDVHIRRLRAKLGPEYEQLVGTVRNVGYRFDPPIGGILAEASGDGVEPESS